LILCGRHLRGVETAVAEEVHQVREEAMRAINALSDSIERRKQADAEVGKAQRDVAIIRAKAAENLGSLNTALRDFAELEANW
jgi:hypothetical protein